MSPEAAEPLLSALRQLFEDSPPAVIGVAVSGGGDSMALLHLAHRAFPGCIHAVTVDHGLRPESADEAALVAAFCVGLGIAHQTLRWQGPRPTGNLMDQARHARLALIAEWARGLGGGDVLLGHTADDQAETFLMTLARASGLDGLSGLRPRFVTQGVTFHRPLLEISRDALRRYLTAQGVGWIDDPSNENDRFTRARARKVLAALAPLGVEGATIARTVRNLAAAREALQGSLARFARDHVQEVGGALQLGADALMDLPDELQRRLLTSALRWIAGASHPPREAQLDQLRGRLRMRKDATLGGVRFMWRGEGLTIARELRAVQGPTDPGQLWDGRWRLSGPAVAAVPAGRLGALGPKGLHLCPDAPAEIPRAALLASPALWHGDSLFAAPLAGFGPVFTATLSQGFADFILSH